MLPASNLGRPITDHHAFQRFARRRRPHFPVARLQFDRHRQRGLQEDEELKKFFPKGVDYSIPYDTTTFVRDSIRDVVKTLFEAIAWWHWWC